MRARRRILVTGVRTRGDISGDLPYVLNLLGKERARERREHEAQARAKRARLEERAGKHRRGEHE